MSYNVTLSTAATSNRSQSGEPDIYTPKIYSMPQHRAIMNKTADSNGDDYKVIKIVCTRKT